MPKKQSRRRKTIDSLCSILEESGILDPNKSCGKIKKGKKPAYKRAELEKLIFENNIQAEKSEFEVEFGPVDLGLTDDENVEFGEREYQEFFAEPENREEQFTPLPLDYKPVAIKEFLGPLQSTKEVEEPIATPSSPDITPSPVPRASTQQAPAKPPPATPTATSIQKTPQSTGKAPPAPAMPGSIIQPQAGGVPPAPVMPGSTTQPQVGGAPPAPKMPGSIVQPQAGGAPPAPKMPGSTESGAPPAPKMPGSGSESTASAPPKAPPQPSGDTSVKLLGDIKSGVPLKKAPEPQPAKKDEDPREKLLAGIAGGASLLKPTVKESKPAPAKPKGPADLFATSMLGRRASLGELEEANVQGQRLYSAESIVNECAAVDIDTCEARPWCDTEFGDEDEICVPGEVEDLYPDWWSNKYANQFDLSKLRKWLQLREAYIRSNTWSSILVKKLKEVAISDKINDDAKLAQVAVWRVWTKNGILDTQLNLLRDGLYGYSSPSWSFELVMKNIFSSLDNSFDWQSCIAELDCAGQALYRALSSVIMDDIQDVINLGEQGDTEEKLVKFESTQDTVASNLAKFQELEQAKETLTNQIQQLATTPTEPGSAEESALQLELETLRTQLSLVEAEEDALRGNVELSTAQVEASTLLANKKQMVQDEINALKERLAKSIVPPGAETAKQAAVAVEQRTLKARLQLAERRLAEIENEIISLSKPVEPKSNPLVEKRAVIAQQLEDAKTELSKFPARGGNVSRKSKLKNNIIPDLEQQLAEVDKALQAKQ